LATVNRDISYLRNQAKDNIKTHTARDYEKCLIGLTAITKEAWTTVQNTEDKKDTVIVFGKECYSMKLDLLPMQL
jgi:hypothetical protein